MKSKLSVSTDEKRVGQAMTWIGAVLALIISIAVPTSYFQLEKTAIEKELRVDVRARAAIATQAVISRKSDWQASVAGLMLQELLTNTRNEQRLILDNRGHIVDQNHVSIDPFWVISERAELYSEAEKVGQVVISRSLRSVAASTLVVGFLAACVGLAMFISLRLIPLNALRKTIEKLRQTESQARQAAESNFQIVFKNALDGIILTRPNGDVLIMNDSASTLLQITSAEATGLNVRGFLDLERQSQGSGQIAPGQFETHAHTRSGASVPVEVSVSDSIGINENQRILILRDITERKGAQLKLQRLANYDTLTGLPNRARFRECLQDMIERRKQQQSQTEVSEQVNALMFLDLDRFKVINDTLGHEVGDQLLMQVADCISQCLRQDDFLIQNKSPSSEAGVFRLGGDEFTVLIENLPNNEVIASIAARINAAVAQPFQVGVHQLYVSASIGIAVYDATAVDIDSLIKQADLAMYRSKNLGKDTYSFYTAQLQENILTRHNIETALRLAIDRKEFGLVYQPKANFITGEITGVEVLLRWHQADGKTLEPDSFMQELEETGLIVPVGIWGIQEACAAAKRWQRDGIRDLTVAVNLSARQFKQKNLVEEIEKALLASELEPRLFEIEVSESSLLQDTQQALETMQRLAKLGIKVAIDDFGTANSALRYLKRFDIDTLKIDRSFVRDIAVGTDTDQIAAGMISLARGMGLKVIADGVETKAQSDFLKAQGCDEVQGYLLSRPMPSLELTKWLQEKKHVLA
jgi:diguanylate cyclase